MGDDPGGQSQGMFWAKIGGLLAIFGAVFSLTTFVFPISGTTSRLLLSALAVCGSILIYRVVLAVLNRSFDWVSALLVVTMFATGWALAARLVGDRDAMIDSLEDRIAQIDAAPAGVPTTTTTGQPPPPSGDPTTTTGPTTTAVPTTAAELLRQFDPSPGIDALGSGSIKFTIGRTKEDLELPSWRSSFPYIGAVAFREQGMVGQEGTLLGLLAPDASTSFATCRDHTTWTPALNWDQVREGTFICLKSGNGRRSVMRVDLTPDLTEERATLQVTGVTWKPVVDD